MDRDPWACALPLLHHRGVAHAIARRPARKQILVDSPIVVGEGPHAKDLIGLAARGFGDASAKRLVVQGREEPGGQHAGLAVGAEQAVCSVGELQQWVKDRLRSSRTPERIEFWDELPYNETGKLLRRKVREQLAEG